MNRAVVSAFVTLCAALTAQADPLLIDGQPVAWPADAWPIPISDTGLDWRRAAAQWTAGNAGFRPVDAVPVGPDGVITLADWDALRWAEVVGDPALIGFTLVTHEAGVLLDADVVLNVERYAFSDLPDVRGFHRPTTLAHELGHVLGLGHTEAVDALMHAAQEPGEVGAIDAGSWAALSDVSTCCAQIRRPVLVNATAEFMVFEQVTPSDSIRAHGRAAATTLAVDDEGRVELPVGTSTLEVWTTAGQGGVFAVPDTGADGAVDDIDGGPMDASLVDAAQLSPGPADGGCDQGAGPDAPQLWILFGLLPLLCVWRRR